MLQAESTPTTTRRAMLTSIPALAVAAIGAPTLSMVSDAAVLAMEPVISELWERYGVACAAIGRAQTALSVWDKRNPEPEYTMGGYLKNGISADEFRTIKRDWRLRRDRAIEQAGWTDASEHREAVSKELYGALDELAEIPATSADGIRCKARLALRTESDVLAWAIIADLSA